jgi:hypothetical protein
LFRGRKADCVCGIGISDSSRFLLAAAAQRGSSNRACVTGALEKDRHAFQRRFDPPLLCSSHSSVKNVFVVGKQAGASIPTCSTENGGAKFGKKNGSASEIRSKPRLSLSVFRNRAFFAKQNRGLGVQFFGSNCEHSRCGEAVIGGRADS